MLLMYSTFGLHGVLVRARYLTYERGEGRYCLGDEGSIGMQDRLDVCQQRGFQLFNADASSIRDSDAMFEGPVGPLVLLSIMTDMS